MPSPRPSASIINLTRLQRDRAIARADFLACERDLYREFGGTAQRHLDDDQRRRLAYLGHRAGWKRIASDATIVNKDTLRRWYRRLIGSTEAGTGGRPRIEATTIALILTMAKDNSWGNDAWGRRRIRDELTGLAIQISSSSVRNILRRHGIPPAPHRGRGHDEPDVLVTTTDEARNADTVAIDFCHAPVGTGETNCPLRTAHVLIAIHLVSRVAMVVGVTTGKPNADFMARCAMTLTGPHGFLPAHQATRIRMDHDNIFSPTFRASLTGVTVERTAVRCPWQNGHAERFVKTLTYGILRKAIWKDEASLRLGCDLFIQHYVTERPHQALDGRTPVTSANPPPTTGTIMRKSYLGGLINHYYRKAA
jgi:transposase InsO family protein